jgi:hypothetical protein
MTDSERAEREQARASDYWQKMHKPQWMAFMLRQNALKFVTARKWWLMSSAFGRTCLPLLSGSIPTEVVELCERWADSQATSEEVTLGRKKLEQVQQPTPVQTHCVRVLDALFSMERGLWATNGLEHILQVHRSLEGRVLLCNIIRDIFGNPFRPVAFDPAWRSEAAVALARAAYESRNFTLLPILADALEEAGCDHPDVLAHCRQPDATHVRGCWVVDLVLGKN